MTIQPLWKFLPFALQRAACRSFIFLMLLALFVMGLPALSGAQETVSPMATSIRTEASPLRMPC